MASSLTLGRFRSDQSQLYRWEVWRDAVPPRQCPVVLRALFCARSTTVLWGDLPPQTPLNRKVKRNAAKRTLVLSAHRDCSTLRRKMKDEGRRPPAFVLCDREQAN